MSDDREKELQQALAGCVLDSSWFYCVAGVGLAIPIGVRLKSYNPLVYLGLSGTLLDLLNGEVVQGKLAPRCRRAVLLRNRTHPWVQVLQATTSARRSGRSCGTTSSRCPRVHRDAAPSCGKGRMGSREVIGTPNLLGGQRRRQQSMVQQRCVIHLPHHAMHAISPSGDCAGWSAMPEAPRLGGWPLVQAQTSAWERPCSVPSPLAPLRWRRL